MQPSSNSPAVVTPAPPGATAPVVDHTAAIAALGAKVNALPDHTASIAALHKSLAELHGKLDNLRAPAIHPAIVAFANKLTEGKARHPETDVVRIPNSKLMTQLRKRVK